MQEQKQLFKTEKEIGRVHGLVDALDIIDGLIESAQDAGALDQVEPLQNAYQHIKARVRELNA